MSDISAVYAGRLDQLAAQARACIIEHQVSEAKLIDPGLNANDLGASEFPRASIERVRDSNLPDEEKQKLLAFLLGTWFVDSSGGRWAYVPMLADEPELYLHFGLGVQVGGMYWNAAESARGIIDGDDLDLKEEMLRTDIRLAKRRVNLE